MKITRPLWAEINLDNLAHNMREVRRLADDKAMITAVIKADGYGHGASDIGETLLANGADRFAVATLSEAIRLRQSFPNTPILIFGYTPTDLAPEIVENKLIQTIYSLDQAELFSAYAVRNDVTIKVHLKIDSGMSRLGFLVNDQGIADAIACFELAGLEVEGVYTHFARADENDKQATHQQFALFKEMFTAIEDAGYEIKIKHCANSATIIDLPEYHLDMVRAGIMLYGLSPSDELKGRADLKQVMSLRAMISHVKKLPVDTGISYGHIYSTSGEEIIASLPLGYADGFSRLLSDNVDMLYKGKRVKLVGRICMDQCMLKLDDEHARRGNVVTIFGEDNGAFKSIDELAKQLGTINYEIVCMIDKRVMRHYIRDGKLYKIKDDLLNLAYGRTNGI